jgi:hypothetical protein
MGERRGAYRALVGKPEGRCSLKDPDVDGRTVLKWILKKKTKATKCSDHRTISLVAHTAKIIAKILKRRIERKIEDILGENQ